ncbi:MAG: PEP-CTERM sorting domain-containing protein [Pirellulales bacterium]
MRCNTVAAALVVALLMVAGVEAGTPVVWTGGSDTWRGPNRWNTNQGVLQALGGKSGWDSDGGVLDPDVLIDGPGSHVTYDQNTTIPGEIEGGSRDFRWRPRATTPEGTMTISGGASFSMTTNNDADPDGQWMQFNGGVLTITGEGSLLRRAWGGTDGNQLSAGKFQLRGIRSEDTGSVEMNITDGGRFETDGGQTNFGDFGRDFIDSTVLVTIDGASSIDSKGGANWDYLGGALGGGGNGEINFFRGWDPTANGGAGGITDEDYKINITGHGGSINIGENGIIVSQQIGPDGAADYDFATFLFPVTYEQLYTGLDRGTFIGDFGSPPAPNGPSIEDIPPTLQASGSNAAAFGDVFAVRNSSGMDDYRVTSIQGAGAGGSHQSDINGDLFVDAADAGAMIGNFGTGTLLSEGDIVDDNIIDAADAGLLINDFGTAYDPGPSAANSAIAEYNIFTGKIVVSANGVSNWYVESASGGMTGPDSIGDVLPIAGGLVTDNPLRVGETVFGGDFSYADVNLGRVAEGGLNDVQIWFNGPGFGGELTRGIVNVVVPEPASIALIGLGLCGVLASRRRLMA